MKLLWLSNFRFTDEASAFSGTWIETMGKGILSERSDIELFNVTTGPVRECCSCDACGIRQWMVPYKWVKANGEPKVRMVEALVGIARDVKPDLIHVWGTERFWGLVTARGFLKEPALLEMQGMPSSMVPYMTGGLTQREIHRCFGVKETLIPARHIASVQNQYDAWSEFEQEIIRNHHFIDYQSEWIKARLDLFACHGTHLYKTRMMIRDSFLKADPWSAKKVAGSHRILSYCGIGPNKGSHIALRAAAHLKRRYPDVQLVMPGHIQEGIRRGGYVNWFLKEVERLGMAGAVKFPGALTATQLVDEMQQSNVVLIPSMVESYSMTLAESMAVGCPIVVSYAGAMPEIAQDRESALFFPIADVGMCAYAIDMMFCDVSLATRCGVAAMIRSRATHGVADGIARQIEIYNAVMAVLKKGKGF